MTQTTYERIEDAGKHLHMLLELEIKDPGRIERIDGAVSDFIEAWKEHIRQQFLSKKKWWKFWIK